MDNSRSKTFIKRAAIAALACTLITVLSYLLFQTYNRPRMALLSKIHIALVGNRIDLNNVSIDRLIEAGLLDATEVEQAGFVSIKSCQNADGTFLWWATASPVHPLQGNCYYINSKGERYYHLRPFTFEVDSETGLPPKFVTNQW